MDPSRLWLPMFVSVPALCILFVLFLKCLRELMRHRHSRPWMFRLFVSRQLLIAACMSACMCLIGMASWSLLATTHSRETCNRLGQLLGFLAFLALFFLYCFLFARLQSIGLFQPLGPIRKYESGALDCLNLFISALVACYACVPWVAAFVAGSGKLIPLRPIKLCLFMGKQWFRDLTFSFDVIFGILLTGGFCLQIYRVSKVVSPQRDMERWMNYKRLLRRSLLTGVVTTGILAFVMLGGAHQIGPVAPYVSMPIVWLILCSLSIYSLRLPRTGSRNEGQSSSLQFPAREPGQARPGGSNPARVRPQPGSPFSLASSETSESSVASWRLDLTNGMSKALLVVRQRLSRSSVSQVTNGSQQSAGGSVNTRSSQSFVHPGTKHSGSVGGPVEAAPGLQAGDEPRESEHAAMMSARAVVESTFASAVEEETEGGSVRVLEGKEGRDVKEAMIEAEATARQQAAAKTLTIHQANSRTQLKHANENMISSWDLGARRSSEAMAVLDNDDKANINNAFGSALATPKASLRIFSQPDSKASDPATQSTPSPSELDMFSRTSEQHSSSVQDETGTVRVLMPKNIPVNFSLV
eukprot:g29196.t1